MNQIEMLPGETATHFAARVMAMLKDEDPEKVIQKVMEMMRNNGLQFPTISVVLNDLMEERKKSVEVVAGFAGIEPSTLYRIKNRQRNATRNNILRIAMALELSFEETQILLKSGNCAQLSASRKRDLFIMQAIVNKNYDITALNKTLDSQKSDGKKMPNLNGRG